jgi:hypothetical protein
MKLYWSSVSFVFGLFAFSCGTDNKMEPYSPLTDEQSARQAVDKKDWQTAIDLYAKIIGADSERYDLVPLYATALAGKGGITVLQIVIDQLGSASEAGSGVGALLDGMVPANADSAMLASVDAAVDVIATIPSAVLDADTELNSTVLLQHSIYATVYTAMLLDSLVGLDENGNFDPSAFASMTDEEASAILDAFIQAGSIGGGEGEFSSTMQTAANQIDSMEGDNTKEKLENFLSQ